MTSWDEMAAEVPDLAARVRACFAVGKHATLATLRADGGPRISGTEVEFSGGEVFLGSMPGAVKARDLLRDGRFGLHSPSVDPPDDDPAAWPGEAKLAGIAFEVPHEGSHRFRLDLLEVVLTHVETDPDVLVVESWHPGRGFEVVRRA
ncbi:MAG: pyridoxamine 5-phosphate oxidase-related FMN-binding [Frankiales bacterium]|nr:pyridoxamine 5-phosphate oxidase-related FMN-binding [Frankiales bacterium]